VWDQLKWIVDSQDVELALTGQFLEYFLNDPDEGVKTLKI